MGVCYICQEDFSQDLEAGRIINPCNCTTGVHQKCLERWINSRNNTTPTICEICKTPYSLDPVEELTRIPTPPWPVDPAGPAEPAEPAGPADPAEPAPRIRENDCRSFCQAIMETMIMVGITLLIAGSEAYSFPLIFVYIAVGYALIAFVTWIGYQNLNDEEKQNVKDEFQNGCNRAVAYWFIIVVVIIIRAWGYILVYYIFETDEELMSFRTFYNGLTIVPILACYFWFMKNVVDCCLSSSALV